MMIDHVLLSGEIFCIAVEKITFSEALIDIKRVETWQQRVAASSPK